MSFRILPTLIVISILILSGCGGRSSAPVTTTVQDAKAQHDQAVAGFINSHPAHPLTISGKIDVGGGIMIDSADGKTNYQHCQATVGYQDASQLHGTVVVSCEDGIVAEGLYQTTIILPHVVGITEATNPNNFVDFTFAPFCTANGVTVNIVGYDSTAPGNTGQSIFTFSLIDPPAIYNPPERHFDSPLYMDGMTINVSTDLCSFITVKPTVTMKF